MKKQFESFTEFAQEIDRIEQTKKDFVVNTGAIKMMNDTELDIDSVGSFEINNYAHGQIANKLGIPKTYYDKMAEIPSLRTLNVNAWFKNSEQSQMVRTLDNKARAFLSDRYRPIDNFLILQSFLPALQESHKEIKIISSNLSEQRMYLQLVFPMMQAEVKPGDVVRWGIILTNSETGAGAVDVKRFIDQLSCSNGLILQSIMRKHHIGKRIDTENESNYELFHDDTIQAEMESFKLRLRDILAYEISDESFQKEVEKMRSAADDKIFSVTKVVEEVTKRYNIPNKYQDFMIENMASEGNINRWGLVNSITALSKEFDNPDVQYDLEKLGGKIISLTSSEWSTINKAA